MKKQRLTKRLLSIFLAVLMAFTGLIPAVSAFAGDGVEGYHTIELFYKETDTIVPSTMLNEAGEEVTYIEYMVEGDELQLTYKLIDTIMPDNGYIKWYSETPTLVDVTQEGVVKAFDSSKGAVIHTWIDNEVKTIPLVGSLIAQALEKVLFNDKVNVDTMDTDAIIAIVEAAFGSDSPISKWVESYKGELIDSLRYYLDNINSNIHVQLFAADGTLLADDYVRICVTRNNEWYANFLPNGTHITNKSQINTTVAVGSTCQLYAITTPVRLEYGCIYSVKSTSVFDQGKVVATVDDSGLVTFKNPGTVTIMVSPDTEQVIQNILAFINKFYEINGEMIDSDKVAEILIKYIGIDMNRNVLAAILDACFAIADIAGGATDPVKLTATAAKLIGNLVLQFAYNDKITFTVVEAQPITDFKIDGATQVQEGTEIQLSITDVQPSTGDMSDITWRSSDPSIASVDPKTGVIIGRDAGQYGALGSAAGQDCTIYAVSAANNVERSYTIKVVGKLGKPLSDVEISGEKYLEMGMETDYSYTVFPKRTATSDNLYITWGVVTGEDEEGNTTYAWADAENPATDGRGTIDAKGHYVVNNGGVTTIVLKAQTGVYLSNGTFTEFNSFIKTMDITNGIPVEKIEINASKAVGIASSIKTQNTVDVNGEAQTYVSVNAGTQYLGLGAVLNAAVYPENASNQNLTWVIDNGYYESEPSSDTHQTTVKQKASHEVADTVNIYAVSADGRIRSNLVTVCVSKNSVDGNKIVDADKNKINTLEVINGKSVDVMHDIDFKKGADGTYSACYKCNWYSSDESVFTVTPKNNDNRDAVINGVDVGTATLYCISADGGVMDTCEVTVYPDKEYLKNIVSLCDRTVVTRTKDNASLYKVYMHKLDLAYAVLYDQPMASQTACNTYAEELLNVFYRLGGFVGILGVDILGKNATKLDSDHITVNVGSVADYRNYSYDFDYTIKPDNAMYSSITWESSNPNISVDRNGICKPVKNEACSAIITCTVTDYMGDSISDSVFVAFSRTPATGVTLDKTSIEGGKIGETETLKATVNPKPVGIVGGASNTAVYWSSSNPSIASVDQNGVVTFIEGGRCVITATTYDGGKTAECAVNVVTNYTALDLLVKQYNDLALNSVNFYPDSWAVYTETLAKAQQMLEAADSSQAEVNKMYDELKGAYESLQKYNYIQNIELYLDGEQTQEFYQYDLSLLKEGLTYKNAILDLNVRLYPNNASYESVKWESSTTDISVTNDGKCSPTANKSCYGLITCYVKDHFGNVFTDTVWVSFSFVPVTSLGLSKQSISGEVGTTYKLGCTVYPTGTSLTHIGAASIQDYFWESDNEEIATVDQDGVVTFVSTGATVIRAVSYDGGISAECIASTNGDRTALKKAIEDYKNVDYKNYALAYGKDFTDAYEAAEIAMNDVSYTQEEIDRATENLNNAYEAMAQHPFVFADSVKIDYTTTKKPLVGSYSQVSSGTVGASDAVSVNLSKNYSNYNDYNWITLTAFSDPADAMVKSISWTTDNSYKAKVEISGGSVKVTPDNGHDNGAWAILTATIVDDYDRVTTRTIYVLLSDRVCTDFDITEASKNLLADAEPTPIEYTISGDPEFKDIIWSSNNESVVKVDANGNLIPVDKGTAKVTGKTVDGGFEDTIIINVSTNFAPLIEKSSTYYELVQNVKDGYTYTKESLDALSAVIAEAQTMISDARATQAEVDDMEARLDEAYNGLVRYVAVTTVKLTAEEEVGVETVKDGYIRYTGTMINGKEITLKPIFNAEKAVYSEIKYESTNSNIVVDENGIVTNKSAIAGSAKITCTVTNVFGYTCTDSVYVTFARYGVTGISFDKEMVYGAPAAQVLLTPTITNTNGTSLASSFVKTCTYTSSNPEIASVDDGGVVTFNTQGMVTITATTTDGGYSATINAFTTWDSTALKAAIDEAEKYTYTNYAYEYGTAFNTAYNEAKEVYADVYASQAAMDEACLALTEATSRLEGHEFIVPQISLTQGDSVIANGAVVQVDAETAKTTLALTLNDGAMVKSTSITIDSQEGVEAVVNGNNIDITKTADKGSISVSILVVDDYDREYTASYSLSIIDRIIPVTSLVLTANGEEINGSVVQSGCGIFYRNYKTITVGYIPTPANANAITSVEYTSSASGYITIDKTTGVVNLTTAGKSRSSNATTIKCKVTNADGSTAEASFALTLTT